MAGSMNNSGKWQFWIDRGGTFTDVVARDQGGRLTVRKVLSDDGSGQEAAVRAIRAILDMATLPPSRLPYFRNTQGLNT